MVSKLILFNKFRALCICGTRFTSARRLSRLIFGFWGVTYVVDEIEPPCPALLLPSDPLQPEKPPKLLTALS
ncbi:hypothetical protein SLEP1_g12623 [Rubroshorea leprosula]|uniref:Uncharacterized protein n=1 Tax=Rubroshorea leprosula TaxID=152421 RepID=A0AAV5IL34_9ROSI|nr:hypothetical protein SLEP1_g12623 [Rubroshorea leprosula]